VGRRAIVACCALLLSCVSEPDYEGRACSELAPCPDKYVCSADGRCTQSASDGLESCVGGERRACFTVAREKRGIGGCTDGFESCIGGAWSACKGEIGPAPESCNGVDDDCDGRTDEELDAPMTCGIGACARTVASTCLAGAPVACTPGEPSDEVCNGIDDDCDGEADEGLGDVVTCGAGACQTAVVQCSGASEIACVPGVPSDETCNGIDDDCNGLTDEGLPQRLTCGTGECMRTVEFCTNGAAGVCTPGSPVQEICNGLDDDCDGTPDNGFGTTITCGTGECRRTVTNCEGTGPGSCTPGAASAEVCNGLDDDCDDEVDEGLDVMVSCGVGACRRSIVECLGGTPRSCTAGTPSAEVCNGIDDDCDGETDEDQPMLSCGLGVCRRTTPSCADGVPQVCAPGAPSPEICNGLDDDCNDQPDDGLGTSITCGTGECRRTVANCTGGTPGTCTPGVPSSETCNALDDDCDDAIDEGLDTQVSCGTGACRRTVTECVGGRPQTCSPGAPSNEVCNGIDDDCDGTADEGFPMISCGAGLCARQVPSCLNGVPQTCVPGQPAAEICDGRDNNCDGRTDEIDCQHEVWCTVFNDGYSSQTGTSDAIFVAAAEQACVPGGASGVCRRWFGRCRAIGAADGHAHDVSFHVFDDGYTNLAGPFDAIYFPGAGQACIPGGASGVCRRWFGRGVTTTVQGHSHSVWCSAFNDGYASPTGLSDAIFWNGSSLCVPGGASGDCRRWFGRCVTR
jgi:hypothetical protein